MAGLSKRLKMIADNIEKGQTMADIGTDHGFLPLYLWENEICPKVVMTDVSEKSLKKARETFEGYHRGTGVDFRVASGLSALAENEVDVVVVAGVGGVLITGILGYDMTKTMSFSKYILQPQTGAGKLRYWLRKAGFSFISERLAKEGKFICEMIAVVPPRILNAPPSLKGYIGDIEQEIPCHLLGEEKELFIEFLQKKLIVEKEILKAMSEGNTDKIKKIDDTRDRIKFLQLKIKEALKDATY